MASSTQYTQEYQKAVSAYVQGQYDQAATITDSLVSSRPDDPSLRLLRGHIYCCQQDYDAAQEQYHMVLNLTTDSELISCANESLAKTHDVLSAQPSPEQSAANNASNGNGSAKWEDEPQTTLQSDFTVLQSNAPPADLADLGLGSSAEADNALEQSLETFDPIETDVSDQELFALDSQPQFDAAGHQALEADPFSFGGQEQDLGDMADLDNLGDFGSLDIGGDNPFGLDTPDLANSAPAEAIANVESEALNLDSSFAGFDDPFGELPELSEDIAVAGNLDENDEDLTIAMEESPLTAQGSSFLEDDDFTLAMAESPLVDMEIDDLEINGQEQELFDLGIDDLGGEPVSFEVGADSFDFGEPEADVALEDPAIAATDFSFESFDFGSEELSPPAGLPEESLFGQETALLEELPDAADIVETTPAGMSEGISDLFAQASEDDRDLDPDFGDAGLFPEPVADMGNIDEAESLFDDFGSSPVQPDNESFPALDFEDAGLVAESLNPEQFDNTLLMDENDATIAFGSNFNPPPPDTFAAPEEDESAQALADLPEFDDLDLSNDFDFDGEDDLTIANPQAQAFNPDTFQQDGGTETFAVLPGELDANESFADLDFSLDDSPSFGNIPEQSQEDLAAEIGVFTNMPTASAEMPAAIGQDAPTLGAGAVQPSTAGGSSAPSPTPTAAVSASSSGRPSAPSSFGKQNMTTAVTTGVVSALAAGLVGFGLSDQPKMPPLLLAGAAAGLAGGVASFALGQRNVAHMKRCTTDLQAQCNAIIGGDMSARVPVTSQDEFGQLASSFNQMTESILTVTGDAQKKAEENERQRDDLQRQVIRLLDDVEGAARGDLTVQAEVTADVLGAVADSFNLTIHNLRTIVQQVKVAARQVNRGAADNEAFARSLSSDALRQAEELAVTLNSVQMMTNAIQRVADSAKEANDVARNASETALKGGEAVERTVAGILQIRETVAETTRKVKRLAESSQEIAKIVGVISQIASRTNLLALNASIEAARAGESGRGFAVVADEVRQLADRAAKASKEIEQIVLQIQSETGAVMTAMEEGTQQVIDGTKRAEQAKRSLEDIIQVSSQIDTLVRSITNATVEQTETARSMAQVMQSVELTAQATSQEAQRVSDSLQGLVSVARGLQTSVERFRVEQTEDQG